jgi:hypothetical protein
MVPGFTAAFIFLHYFRQLLLLDIPVLRIRDVYPDRNTETFILSHTFSCLVLKASQYMEEAGICN